MHSGPLRLDDSCDLRREVILSGTETSRELVHLRQRVSRGRHACSDLARPEGLHRAPLTSPLGHRPSPHRSRGRLSPHRPQRLARGAAGNRTQGRHRRARIASSLARSSTSRGVRFEPAQGAAARARCGDASSVRQLSSRPFLDLFDGRWDSASASRCPCANRYRPSASPRLILIDGGHYHAFPIRA
jgi:hypothetical protein